MEDKIFVTGIGTGVGKTYVSTAICQVFGHQYWKPVQSGSMDETDSDFVSSVIGEDRIIPENFKLQYPVSPHWAATLEGKEITVERLMPIPEIEKICVEGAGGLFVPLNNRELFLDFLLQSELHPVIVVQHYLGSINHTLLTLSALVNAGLTDYTLVWNSDFHEPSESVILSRFSPSAIYRLMPVLDSEWLKISFNKEL